MTGATPGSPHGGDGLRVARALGLDPRQVVDLSASLSPSPPDLADVLAGELWRAGHYPDSEEATGVLAGAIGVEPARLVITNGGSEAIALLALERPHGHVVEPEFSLYRRHLDDADDPAGGRWRSNPCNPLGTLAAPTDVATVWDEAYWPMTTGTWTRGDDASWRLGSLTKLWACPGLRLGYLIAPDAGAARRVGARQPRWSVNSLALAALPVLLERDDLPTTARRIAELRTRFADDVASLGYVVRPGVAPWLLLDHTAGLRRRLAPAGIVVRDCASYGLAGVHRVALPTDAAYDRVLGELARARPAAETTS